MAQPIPPKNYKLTDLTILAEKYGHPRGPEHEVIAYQYPYKSGITPLPNLPFQTDQETFEFIEQEIHQRDVLSGLLSSELHAVEGLAPMLDPTHDFLDDTVQIHPLYQRQRWCQPLEKHLAKYPLGGGRAGYWEADNPRVWEAITPALRMASLFLTSAHFWPWWDALIAGEYNKIPKDQVPEPFKESTYLNFNLRDPVAAGKPEEQAKLQELFLRTCQKVDLNFSSGRAMHGGLTDDKHAYGTSRSASRYYTTSRVSMAFELVEPLLRDDLTSAERAVDLFKFAVTLIHETAHAVWMATIRFKWKHYNNVEPFFEDEVISELGFSLENALFGGFASDLLTYNRGPDGRFSPSGGILQGRWNTTYHEFYQLDQPCLIPRPTDFNVSDIWMIPTHVFLNMNDKNFWSGFVQSFGNDSKVLHFRPITIGVRRTKPPNAPNSNNDAVNWPRTLLRAPAPSVVDYTPLPIDRNSLTPAKIVGLEYENKRRALAQKVDRALTGVGNRRGNVKIPRPPPPPPPRPPVYKAAKNYLAQDEKEISLTLGEPISVITANSSGYWFCSNDVGKSGLVPSSALVEEIPVPPPPPAPRTSGHPEPTRQLPITGDRYDEIRDYLFRNMRELGLDTMTFPIPEHILFNYILENRGLNITSDEWRDFLMTARSQLLLFILIRDGPSFGTVTKVKAGWPTTPLPPRSRPSWGIPNDTMMAAFQKCATELENRYPFFEGGLVDHDIEQYRRACNMEYFDHPEWLCRTRLGLPIREFTEEIFEAIIWGCERDNAGFAFGPNGTIRKTKMDDPPSKKRKRDRITDYCPNM